MILAPFNSTKSHISDNFFKRDSIQDLLVSNEVLVFANKQDLPHSMSAAELTEKLSLNSASTRHRQWWVQSCCATTAEGLYEGLDWLSATLNKKK